MAKFASKITTKSAVFYRLLYGEVWPGHSREISLFFHEFVPKNPRKFDFFFRDLSEALFKDHCIFPKVIILFILNNCFFN